MSQRVLVCGGRDFGDRAFVFRTLDAHHASEPFHVLIQGAARGADTYARNWAETHNIRCLSFPADWKRNGKAAGPIRNRQMLDVGQPDLVIAFPGGRGTADMVTQAMKNNVRVVQPAYTETT